MLNNNLPFVSILIPIRNEFQYMARCLEAVAEQDYPSDHVEVLVADGMSGDGTFELLQGWASKAANRYVFQNPGKIVPTGLNILIPKAKGNVIIRVDGHCVIAPDYVSNCVRHLEEEGVDGVGGPMRSIGEDLISQVTALAMSSKFGVGNSSFRTETGQTKLADTVPFPAYTRAIIEKVGLYDEELIRNQDDEYNYRIREAGGKILLAEDVLSEYYSRGSLIKLWKQYFQYGFWKVRVLQKHPRQMSLRQFVPLAFVLALILNLFLSLVVSWRWLALLVLLAAYLLANLTTSIITASGQGLKKLLLLPLAFAIIHLSYGLGFLFGLFKFWNRWRDKKGRVPPLDWQA
jgi:cellulose synthase/poly-beta-1,6-N-acetylglucosamine synthase-like glycosyltransferase